MDKSAIAEALTLLQQNIGLMAGEKYDAAATAEYKLLGVIQQAIQNTVDTLSGGEA